MRTPGREVVSFTGCDNQFKIRVYIVLENISKHHYLHRQNLNYTIMTTKEVADRLVSLCREGKIEDAQNELFANDAVSIEPNESM